MFTQHKKHTIKLLQSYRRLQVGLRWSNAMGELKKMKETAIDERIFIEIEICVREGTEPHEAENSFGA